LSCASATFCMEVDRLGRAAVFSGAAWGKPQDVDPLDTQFGVGPGAASCFAAQSCAVLDVGFRLQFFDGQSWSQPGLSSPELSDVGPGPFRLSCTSKSFCVGLNPGSGGVAVYRSGRWSKPVALNGPSYSVSCASSSFCMVAIRDVAYAIYDGKSWVTHGRIPPPLTDLSTWPSWGPVQVSCPATKYCFGIGPQGTLFKFSHNAWAPVSAQVVAADSDTFNSLSCPTISFCEIAHGHDTYAFDDGKIIGPTQVDPQGSLAGLSCPVATFCVAVDDQGNSFVYRA
jgi:hypothetical protein